MLSTRAIYATRTIGNLFAIDPSTANTTLVGDMGLDGMFDVAYNFADGQLYGTNQENDSLYRINRANASVTLIGGPYANAPFTTGLAFEIPAPATGALMTGGLLLLRRRRSRCPPAVPLPGDLQAHRAHRPTPARRAAV